VSCDLAQSTTHPYFDEELDAVRAAEFERHMETCADCRRSIESLASLRSSLRSADLYEHACGELHDRVRAKLGLGEEGRLATPSLWSKWLLAPALAFAVLALVAVSIPLLVQPRMQTQRVASELVDAHVRSLQPGHLADVPSTDQHTVKPWFDGKLAFIPPVNDYAAQGFPLVGGRLDVLDGNPVAALVYGRRKHVINLFVWPEASEAAAPGSGSRNGYNWILWRKGEMRFFLVSDVAGDDLRELAGLIQAKP